MTTTYLRCLTIAGSDSGGGAGIQADLKTFSALGAYGMSVITAITAQNTREVRSVFSLPVEIVRDQLQCVLEDIGVDAVKIGMLHSPEKIRIVAQVLREFSVSKIVLDPVMVAKSGDRLLLEDAVQALKEELLPLSTLVTPNLPEAEVILQRKISSRAEMVKAAAEILEFGSGSVLLKGGHLQSLDSPDIFLEKGKFAVEISSPRIQTVNTHGTGCTLSSAIAVFIAKGFSLEESARLAKGYLFKALEQGARFRLGSGHGPVHHFHELWN